MILSDNYAEHLKLDMRRRGRQMVDAIAGRIFNTALDAQENQVDISKMKTRVESTLTAEPTMDQKLEAAYAEYMFMYGKDAHQIGGECISNLYKRGYLHGLLAAKKNDAPPSSS